MVNKTKTKYIILFILSAILISYTLLETKELFEGHDNPDIGFIVTRCVKKSEQNMLYQECYRKIREFYPKLKIVFIDDNSDKSVLQEIPMENVEIIQSEYPGVGEFLPYYYLYTRKLFKKAMILQDSMLINSRIPYKGVDNFAMFYEFIGADGRDFRKDNNTETEELLKATKEPKNLIDYMNKLEWVGCFGSCMTITYDFLAKVEDKLGIMGWKDIIKTRGQRMGLERAIAIVCFYVNQGKPYKSIYGDIFDMQAVSAPFFYGAYNIDKYKEDKNAIKDNITKIWNSR